jgi:hypothetical protein
MSSFNVDNGKVFDIQIEPGRNFSQAAFKLWIPDDLQRLKGILVVVSGSNMDSRPFLEQASWMEFVERVSQRFEFEVRASVWQDIARRHEFGLIGCIFTDRLHENMFIEEYCDVRQGSGQALLDALAMFSQLSGHPEIEDARAREDRVRSILSGFSESSITDLARRTCAVDESIRSDHAR